MTSLYSTGHGDQRDVSSKDSEGGGGWGDSRDEGTGGHHWVHQAGADSKGPWKTSSLWSLSRVGWWDTASLQSWLKQGQGYLCLLFWTKNRGAFCPFFSLYYLSSSFPSSLPLSPCRFPTALIRLCVAGAGRVRKEEDFKSLFSFLFFSFFL